MLIVIMSPNYFFIVYVITILVTRVCLWFWPRHAPKIGDFQLHHYMYGLFLIAMYYLISNTILLAVGFALVVDELPLFFIFKGWDWPDDHWKQYHSRQSILGIVVISALGYLAVLM